MEEAICYCNNAKLTSFLIAPARNNLDLSGRRVGYLVNQLINRLGGAFLLYLPISQVVERIDNDIFIVLIKCDMVSFFFHKLHLRLAFLLFIPCRLVFLHTLIHIVLDFTQNITHCTKLSLKYLCIHSVILSGKSGKVKAFGIYTVTGA